MSLDSCARRYRSGSGRQYFEHGPMSLVVDIDAPDAVAARSFTRAFQLFENLLEELVSELEILRAVAEDVTPLTGNVASEMRSAAIMCARGRFATPMIAVAGAVADAVRVEAHRHPDVARVLVNNGGDVSLGLSPGHQATVGVVPRLDASELAGSVSIGHDSAIRGVATSGHGGRSLSLGIADAVTVFAKSAAVADAAATMVANAVDLPDHPQIARVPADQIDESAALGSALVPVQVPPLNPDEAGAALGAGCAVAEELLSDSIIEAAILFLSGERALVAPCSKAFRLAASSELHEPRLEAVVGCG